MTWLRWAIVALVVMGSPVSSHASGHIAAIAEQARVEAVKWQRDAQLVQIEITQFGFAMGRSGMPDMTRAGAPGLALLNFFSPSTRQALRINVSLKLTPEGERFLKSHGVSAMQAERLATPVSPYTLPIPAKFVDLDDALATAQKSGIARECTGAAPRASSCALVSRAELHVYWSGTGQSGTPIWTISFGQHPTTYKTVARQVDAASGKVVTVADLQAATVHGDTEGAITPRTVDLSNIGRDFAAAWKVVSEVVVKQDPLYKPYAVALFLSLSENQENPRANVVLHLANVQFARVTPSGRWDDLEVHVEWSSNTSATMTIGAPRRRSAPEAPIPTVITPSKFPDADPSLRKLVNLFPPGYREAFTTTEQVRVACYAPNNLCADPYVLSGPRGLPVHHWESRTVEVKQSTHFVNVWLTRQGNPHYRTVAPPLPSEYPLINQTAPREKWAWWTRP